MVKCYQRVLRYFIIYRNKYILLYNFVYINKYRLFHKYYIIKYLNIMIKTFEQFNKIYEGMGLGQGLGEYNDKMKDYYGKLHELVDDCINEIKNMLVEIGGSFEFDEDATDPLTTFYVIRGGAEETMVLKVYINEERKNEVFVDYANGESGYLLDMLIAGDIFEVYIAIAEYVQNQK